MCAMVRRSRHRSTAVGHEDGRREYTQSALLAVGLGTACALASDLAPMHQVRVLRDRFRRKLQEAYGNRIVLNVHPEHRLPLVARPEGDAGGTRGRHGRGPFQPGTGDH
jgi:cysteine sulfinate desulfinase/cysteine desulfurase-like protein